MSSTFEIIAIILIIVAQIIISVRTHKQIVQLNTFLPNGKESLSLEEYEVDKDKILELEPSQIINKSYLIDNNEVDLKDDVVVEDDNDDQPIIEHDDYDEEIIDRLY